MSNFVEWIAAEAEKPEGGTGAELPKLGRRNNPKMNGSVEEELLTRGLPAHQFPGRNAESATGETLPVEGLFEREPEEVREEERLRRIYRARTTLMLRRYMRYSIEAGRMPSILGGEMFRAKMTAYMVVTFEDRVIFVHDMETCLGKLDEFSRQLIARHILQEHDRWETARLLHCNEKTVRRLTPLVLDVLTEILLDVGLMERLESNWENSCQGGPEGEIVVSGCEDGENKF